MLTIKPIPAFNDNYIWSISENKSAVVVDPGCAQSVSDYLQQNELNLVGILITHHHLDHTGGIEHLKGLFDCPVYAGVKSKVSGIDHYLAEGEKVRLLDGSLVLEVMNVPGHTLDHIAYFNKKYLFCGDTLFSAGCGRLFEGSAQQMYNSLKKIAKLDNSTLVFPTHEYTLANIEFALAVEPENQRLNDYHQQVINLRKKNTPSLPSTVQIEKLINPFLRSNLNSIQEKLIELGKLNDAVNGKPVDQTLQTIKAFAALRNWKDAF